MDKGLLYLILIFGAGWLILDEFFGKHLISKFAQYSFGGYLKPEDKPATITGIPKKLTPSDPTFSGIGPGAMG